jgi:signal transduction histidine kinase
LLAALFVVAIMIDISQPAKAPTITYLALGAYTLFAAALVVATWNNWWLDAKLAGPAHTIDIFSFTLLVFVTEGYTSPYFIFFVFILLAAAIRWGWKETTLTAILLTVLFLGAGLLTDQSDRDFDIPRFLVRGAQLIIVSLILIWFGANQWRARFLLRPHNLLSEPSLDRSPVETALMAAMAEAGAACGGMLWTDADRKSSQYLVMRDDRLMPLKGKTTAPHAMTPILYDVPRRRALYRDSERTLRGTDPVEALGAETIAIAALTEGLAMPISLDKGHGLLFLEQVRDLSTDHLDLGDQIGREVAAHIQRHALLKAAEESAEARSRLILARDLHDSVVQFLAGAAFRIEAMRRAGAAGPLEPELNELKQLMMEEQKELRSFITTLRSGPEVTLRDLGRDLRVLAQSLGKQWAIECSVNADANEIAVPTRLHLDAHQLVREAVANAVRHAGAKNVRIVLETEGDVLHIDVVNDGGDYPRSGDGYEAPQTLRERAAESGGHVEVSRGMDVTKVSISLPLQTGRAA